MRQWGAKKTDRLHNLFGVVLLTTALIIRSVPFVYAAPALLGSRYDKASTSQISAVSSHLVGFDYTNFTSPVGSLEIEFCSNDPIPENACVAPAGFDATGVLLTSQSGEAGFTVHPNSTANDLILTRAPVVPANAASSYQLENIINPGTVGTYYIRLMTFSSIDASGAVVEQGGIALSTNDNINVSTEVPPHLTFCVGTTIPSFNCASAEGFFIDLGELSTDDARFASSQFMVATNAAFGYSVSVNGTSPTSGINVIPPIAAQSPSTPGTSQFGINLRLNSSPPEGQEPDGPGTASPTAAYNSPNLFRYQSGDTLVSVANSNDFRRFTVSYIVNISPSQHAGLYSTTFSYICLGNF